MLQTDDLARWESLELWKKDVDMKFGQFTDSSKAQTAAIHELRSMLSTFLDKEESERVMPKSNMNDHHITAAKANITLSDSGSGFEYGSKGAKDVCPKSMPKQWKAA